MKRFAIALALIPLLFFAACTPAEEQAAEQDIDSIQSEAFDETADFRMNVEARLDDVDIAIDSLEAEAAQAGDEAESQISSTVAELREERDSLQRDLEQLASSTVAGFEDLRADLELRMDELEADVEAAHAELTNGNGEDQSS